jgi:PPP family 3-phenylpropionic acid transporter
VEISFVLAAPLISRVIFTPLISFIADRSGNRRRVLIALGWGSLASLALLIPLTGFWPLLLASVLFGVFWTSIMPLTESIAMTEVKLQGLDYGRMRLWGSLTFILASFGGGFLIDLWGSESVLYLLMSALMITSVIAYSLPDDTSRDDQRRLRKATPLPPIHWREATALVHSKLFILFLLTSATIQASHAIYYGFGTLHWQSLGLSSGLIGGLWAIGVIAEVLLFAWSKPIVEKLGPVKLLQLAAVGALLRWLITAFDPPMGLLVVVQTLHALTYGAGHLGAIHFIAQAVPENYSATGQGLYAAFAMGVIMGLATTVAGSIYNALGGQAYLIMSVLGGLSLLGALALSRTWNGGLVIGKEEKLTHD